MHPIINYQNGLLTLSYFGKSLEVERWQVELLSEKGNIIYNTVVSFEKKEVASLKVTLKKGTYLVRLSKDKTIIYQTTQIE